MVEEMTFTLERQYYNSYGVFGLLLDESGKLAGVTLEHAFPQVDGSYSAAVPLGTYTCRKLLSPKFGFNVFMLDAVPGHSYIEIHPGNFNCDSDGCILLGNTIAYGDHGEWMITQSRDTISKFMSSLEGEDSIVLVVKDQLKIGE